jgi:glucose-6-phosphate dehydrogenase assembly protein OpcA
MSAEAAPRVLSHPPRPVDLHAIEHVLKQLWKAADDGHDGEDAVLRACMSNLFIYCDSQAGADAVSAELDAVVRAHPARLILLVGESESPGESLAAHVSARCHLGADDHQICSEQITLSAARDVLDRLPSMARPLRIGDLPSSLWWFSDTPPTLGGDLFEALREMSDQVIYSSLRWPDPVRGTLATAAWAASAPAAALAIADLVWRELKPWRRLIGQTLDPAVLPGALEQIDRVEIDHGPHGLTQAWLLAGWLASRLQWQAQRGVVHAGQQVAWRFHASQGGVELRIRRLPEGAPAFRSLRVGWRNGDARPEVAFAPADSGRLAATSPVLGPEPRTLIVAPATPGRLVAAQLQDIEPDPLFRDALNVAREMAESLVS